MKYLITGGCGLLGSNIVAKLLEDQSEIIIFDNLFRPGSEKNLEWLKKQGDFLYINGDIRNYNDVEKLIIKEKPEVIFHLAGQVSMTTSIVDPRLDFEINALGTFNLLDVLRRYNNNATVIYSSTNKVYGDIEWEEYIETETRYIPRKYPNGFPESIPLDFHSPYGNSKGAADQYMLDFHRIYGIKTVVFRHSSMYGPHQFSTYDQGWIGWFCIQALLQKNKKNNFTISGNGKQVRDILYSDDIVSLYLLSVANIELMQGQAFNIGGGIDNSISIMELFEFLENKLEIRLQYEIQPPRESDQKVFVADLTKIQKYINWKPSISKHIGIMRMLEWVDNIQLSIKSL